MPIYEKKKTKKKKKKKKKNTEEPSPPEPRKLLGSIFLSSIGDSMATKYI